jgi:hypothetical protein
MAQDAAERAMIYLVFIGGWCVGFGMAFVAMCAKREP